MSTPTRVAARAPRRLAAWVVASPLLAATLVSSAAPHEERAQGPREVTAPVPQGFDRERAAADALRFASGLVALDTSAGGELAVARWVEGLLASEVAFDVEVLEFAPGRANCVVHLRADRPQAGPVLLISHADVAPAEASEWTSPPFGARVRDGALYGRGVLDDKGQLAAMLAALLQLADRRGELRRDFVLLVTAGWERSEELGVAALLESRPELFEGVEFVLGYGGRTRLAGDRVRAVDVTTSEKLDYEVVATANGRGGHASLHQGDNSLAALCRAAARVAAWRGPLRLNATTIEYFAGLARVEPDEGLARAMLVLVGDDHAASARAAEVLARVPAYDAALRTVVSLTALEGGELPNVVPTRGRAIFNVRLVPGDSIDEVLADLRQQAAEPVVTWALRGGARGSLEVSTSESVLFEGLERAALAMDPDSVVLPFLSNITTEAAWLRARGIPTYGVLCLPTSLADEARIHGSDERVSLSSLAWGAEFLYRTFAYTGTTSY